MKNFGLFLIAIFCVLMVGMTNNEVAGQTPATTTTATTTTDPNATATDPNATAPADEPKAWEDMSADEKADAMKTDFPKYLKSKYVEVNGKTVKGLRANIKKAEDSASGASKIAEKAGQFSVDNLAMDIYIAKGYKSEQWNLALKEVEELLMDPSANRAKLVQYKRDAYQASMADLFTGIKLEKVKCTEEVTLKNGTKATVEFTRDETPQEALGRMLKAFADGNAKPAVGGDYYTKAEADTMFAKKPAEGEEYVTDKQLETKLADLPTCEKVLAKLQEAGYKTSDEMAKDFVTTAEYAADLSILQKNDKDLRTDVQNLGVGKNALDAVVLNLRDITLDLASGNKGDAFARLHGMGVILSDDRARKAKARYEQTGFYHYSPKAYVPPSGYKDPEKTTEKKADKPAAAQ